jgi:hypothetical protein
MVGRRNHVWGHVWGAKCTTSKILNRKQEQQVSHFVSYGLYSEPE